MLVLSRKAQQDILVGENVRITVLQVKGNTVRLGIEAPREVRVVRGELPAIDNAEPEHREFTLEFGVSAIDRPESGPAVVPFARQDKSAEAARGQMDRARGGRRERLGAEAGRDDLVREHRSATYSIHSAASESDVILEGKAPESEPKVRTQNRVLEILASLTRNPQSKQWDD